MKKAFTVVACLLATTLQAQFSFQYDQRPTVSVNGRALLNPWVGGLNTTQYSTMRLNDDNRDDLVVFDRTNGKVSTFIAIDNPTVNGIAWQYAPQYETAFPGVYSWLLLVDYDGDGRKDLFTNGSSSVRVFRNESQNGQVSFRLIADPLYTFGLSETTLPLYVTGVDIPAITDFDNDGDIDIITFDGGGNLIAYQQNMSVERTGKKDGLDFKRTGGQCWGHFYKEFCNDFTFGYNCDAPGSVGPKPVANGANAKTLHTGNTLTVIDTDGDGNKDLLFGFVTCENIARLRSIGPNNDKATFTSFDSLYPAQNPIVFPAFGATFWEDVDGDGVKDLLASPNVSSNENGVFDFQASGWFYKNAGTNQKPDFKLVQRDFLQNDMIDLGENAIPALADLDGDGDVDLLVGVGYTGTRPRDYRAGLWLFENKGTTQNPAFSLVTTDYLGLAKTLTLYDVNPSFADVDNNGSMDLVLLGTGTKGIEMRVLFNSAVRGAAVNYTLAGAALWPVPSLLQVGELPTVTDVDRDGKPDLLIGKNIGTIHYYRNAGTAQSPVFQLQNQTYGGFNTDTLYSRNPHSLVLADLNSDRVNELVMTDVSGRMMIYKLPDRPDQPLTFLDSLHMSAKTPLGFAGTNLVAAAADLDGDQLPDLMLGCSTGGLRYLRNTSVKVVVTGLPDEPTGPWAFPNPTERYLTIRPPFAGQLDLLSLSGQAMLSPQTVTANTETVVDLGILPDGTYLLRLSDGTRPAQVQKVVVWK